MLEKFQSIKIPKRSYWLNAFLTKSKSILTENALNLEKLVGGGPKKISRKAILKKINCHSIEIN